MTVPAPTADVLPYLVTLATHVLDPVAPSPAGWGAVLMRGTHAVELSQHLCHATVREVRRTGEDYLRLQLRVANRDFALETWTMARPSVGAAALAAWARAETLAKRAALQPHAVAAQRFARDVPSSLLTHPLLGTVTLAPCARVGGLEDWWTAPHVACPGSLETAGCGLVVCACACHLG